MAEFRNVRNDRGIIVGGDVTDSTLTVRASGSVGAGADEAETLRKIDELVTGLLAGLAQLPPEQASAAAGEAVQLKAEVTAPARDEKRIRAALGKLSTAVAAAAPLIEIVKDITDLVTGLFH
jgi:hypothetical protein